MASLWKGETELRNTRAGGQETSHGKPGVMIPLLRRRRQEDSKINASLGFMRAGGAKA